MHPDFSIRVLPDGTFSTATGLISLHATNSAGDGPATIDARGARSLAIRLLQLAQETDNNILDTDDGAKV